MKESIKHWPEHDRPRERLLAQGANSLSDSELLAIFLRSGSQQHSAVELARLLIQHFGGLNAVFDAELSEMRQFHGIGETKYTYLMAVKELGRRYLNNHFQQESLQLNQSSLVLDYLRYELQGEKQEVFAVLCLDANLRKLHFKKLFFGSTQCCHVSIQQTLRYILQQQASFVIVAHNHPIWGHAEPSSADIDLTHRLKSACELIDVQFLDHFIISKNHWFSFAEHGLLQTSTQS
ncbi:MAG: DNA repair protein RadC [Acinetobacter sp.]|nr:DNA repair protein RadC [Acinetobacter sp.]